MTMTSKEKLIKLIRKIDKLPICHCKNCKDKSHYSLIQYANVMTLVTTIFDEELK